MRRTGLRPPPATHHAATGITHRAEPARFDASSAQHPRGDRRSTGRPPSGPVLTPTAPPPEEYRMSPQHRTPGANAETAATPAEESGTEESGKPAESSAPDSPNAPEAAEAPGSPNAPEAPEAPTAPNAPDEQTKPSTPEATAAPVAPEAKAATSGPETKTTAPAGKTTAARATPDANTETPGARVAVAAAVGTTPPGVKSATGVDRGRPRKPVLAGAAIAGAALIAIPLLLVGSARDDGPPDNDKELSAGDTVLNPNSGPAALDDYKAKKPSSSPSEKKPKKPKKTETPKALPKAAAPDPQPSPRKTSEKKPEAKPKPKAAPKPNWGTETVSAPSVLEVKQAWTTNRIRMVMQTDGNLVVYNEKGKPLWASMTFGENHRAIFQPDGNLVIHNGADRPIWASKSHGHEGAQLILRADAKVVIVHNGRVIWST
ncbi:hypothetical protein GCM10010277_60640 [Streptomyces longisporoflavus]|nr:hypothetical protein GCM10010277_60640 [Streptomyces longisporoflavus]